MTSEIEALKTNEFNRRRKLRLQQVREQSNEIAKRIRQRTKVEKLRQVVDLDVKKQKEYLQRQGELVKKLGDLYSKGISNVGASHRSASEIKEQDEVQKVDISKLRGREAAAALRRKKQEKLDEQKKLLDRKLQAREAANEISREKAIATTSKVTNKTLGDSQNKPIVAQEDISSDNAKKADNAEDQNKPITNDMATQWDSAEPEWEPNIPSLALPRDDSAKENIESRSDKSKRLDLFALSEEMPSSLRGGANNNEDAIPIKPSLTLVSEYLQNRALRLRESNTTAKKPSEDLQSIKETILRTRTSKPEVKSTNTEKSSRSSAIESGAVRRNAITMYNHSTRNTRDVQRGDERIVLREEPIEDNAYSQAQKEASVDDSKHKEHQKKVQQMRHRVAMTKHNVEKEYKDTINFLNSLPKDTGRPMRKAYMDEHRQQMQRDNREQKLQQEYNKIEKECRKHSCTKSRNKSKSPVKLIDDELDNRDFQYSWMPVPESDGNLAIHTIPTTVKEGKTGNTVSFSKVDSYHEYRSRHRHTPPTKDTSGHKKQGNKKVEAILIDNNSDITDYSSNASESSSFENSRPESRDPKSLNERELSDAERIIIYKILDSKSDKKCKRKERLMQNILKTLNFMDMKKKHNTDDQDLNKQSNEKSNREKGNSNFEQLNEGIYKTVSKKGDNIKSMSLVDKEITDHRISNEYDRNNLCRCNNRTNEDQQPIKTTNITHRNIDISRPSNNCVSCNCGSIEASKTRDSTTTQVQPSAATSTSSFKTATNDKANSALTDGGYVKLVDDGGQETGKFYIGASGFLKDNAYEVVIQLRKKDGAHEKAEDKTTGDKLSGKEITKCPTPELQKTSSEEIKTNVLEENNDGDEEVINSPINPQPSENITNKVCSSFNTDTNIQDMEKQPININENVNIEIQDNPPKVLIDKGVHTSFQMSFAVPSHELKTDPISRPATSTYTQTTLSSPNHRPMFIHMSSSTSTAYMSPPELVRPQFLRHDYRMTDEEKYDNMRVLNRHGYTSERDYSEDCNSCRCKKCTHAKKIIINKIKPPGCCKKHTRNRNKFDTPPNTVRSRSSGDVCSHKVPSNRGASRSSVKSQSHKHKNHGASVKKHSQNVGIPISSSAASSHRKTKTNSVVRHATSRSDLNPVLKKYINKLLALNRESLKAIEVADQDCSSVTTPGSSIINVTNNLDKNTLLERKISFEQIKDMLRQQIIKESKEDKSSETTTQKRKKISVTRTFRRKTVHKVKSLNISRNLHKNKIKIQPKCSAGHVASSSSSGKEDVFRTKSIDSKSKCLNFVTTSRQLPTPGPKHKSITPDVITENHCPTPKSDSNINRDYNKYSNQRVEPKHQSGNTHTMPCYRSTLGTSSSDTDNNFISQNIQHNIDNPITTSTQTSQNMEAEINLIKLAEDKLQNMEKIADLTEKCTKRLSNLAKVLEEVRKNKSLVYSQISTSESASESDQKSDKIVMLDKNETLTQIVDSILDINKTSRTPSPMTNAISEESREKNVTTGSTDFVPFLTDIPKPSVSKIEESINLNSLSTTSKKSNPQVSFRNLENGSTASRGRPPPALSRITLKNGQDNIVPHELSTVLEVDSLLSVRLTRENKGDTSDESSKIISGSTGNEIHQNQKRSSTEKVPEKDPDLLRSNIEITTKQTKMSGTESSDDSKLQSIDINQFNGIALKPFITFQEHAKKCNVAFDEASNLEDIANEVVTDDISSLHSDGSLPDVIAELLKRNIISEPFKFDTASNVNSTTVSSESTLSVFALSKIRKEKRKSSVSLQNKENIGETSDSLSLSSNPDLEMAFKKLGMGWASSTLKKTKERLALSSSSNTSSSSLSQFKIKSFNQDIPVLVTDSVSSIMNVTKKPGNRRNNINDNSKNAQQQTSLSNSMTVKEFLTNELAKKITFTNKSHRDDTGEEFVSLLETKMPEDMKHSEHLDQENHSVESVRSGNNRARTSTPVQIFKSMTYHSSSSSNLSNGLFSNADDLSSVKVTSNSNKNHSTSDKDDLTVPNFTLRMKKSLSDRSKSD